MGSHPCRQRARLLACTACGALLILVLGLVAATFVVPSSQTGAEIAPTRYRVESSINVSVEVANEPTAPNDPGGRRLGGRTCAALSPDGRWPHARTPSAASANRQFKTPGDPLSGRIAAEPEAVSEINTLLQSSRQGWADRCRSNAISERLFAHRLRYESLFGRCRAEQTPVESTVRRSGIRDVPAIRKSGRRRTG